MLSNLICRSWVKDLIPVGLTILGGKSKVGKSYFMLNLAMTLAQGKRMFGETDKDGFRSQKGKVLYLSLEDNKTRFQRRMREIDSNPNRDLLGVNLIPKFQFDKLHKGGIQKLVEWAERTKNAKLIVIDVLAKVWNKKPHTGGGGLYAEEYQIYSPLTDIARKHGVSVVVVTHTKKSHEKDIFDEILGGSGTQGPADNLIVLSNEEDKYKKRFSIRGKDTDETHLTFDTSKSPGSWVCLGQANEGLRTLERQAIYEFLEKEGSKRYTEIKEAARENLINVSSASINTMLRKMVEEGEIEQLGARGAYAVPGTMKRIVNSDIARKIKRNDFKNAI